MKQNSTFGILKRTGLVASIILAVIVLGRVAFALMSMYIERYSYWGDDMQPSFWDYFIEYTDDPRAIVLSLLGGVGMTALCVIAIGLIWVLIEFILYGVESKQDSSADEDEAPDCANQNCTCVSHRAEVFVDNAWDIQECKNPNCKCVHYHHNESFDQKTNSWSVNTPTS